MTRTSKTEPAVERLLVDGTVVRVTPRAIYEWAASTGQLRRITWFSTVIQGVGSFGPFVEVASVLANGDVLVREQRTGVVWRWSRAAGTIAPALIQTLNGSPDGTALAYEEGPRTVVVNSESYERIAAFTTPRSGITVQLGHAGRWAWYYEDIPVQSGSEWCQFSLVETATGRLIEHRSLIGDLCWARLSPDGLRVVINESVERVIELDPSVAPPTVSIPATPAWSDVVEALAARPVSEQATERAKQLFARLNLGALRRVAASRDERVLALFHSAHWNEWDLAGDVIIAVGDELSLCDPQPRRATWSAALSEDGSRLATSALDGVTLWETAPLRTIGTVRAFPMIDLAFTEDGREVIGTLRDTTHARVDVHHLR